MKKKILFIALMILSMLSMNVMADDATDQQNLLCNCDRDSGEACNKSPESGGDAEDEVAGEAVDEG